MSRSHKDKPGGHDQQRWYICIKPERLREMYNEDRRRTRHKAKQDLKKGVEPPPRYPHERQYYD